MPTDQGAGRTDAQCDGPVKWAPLNVRTVVDVSGTHGHMLPSCGSWSVLQCWLSQHACHHVPVWFRSKCFRQVPPGWRQQHTDSCCPHSVLCAHRSVQRFNVPRAPLHSGSPCFDIPCSPDIVWAALDIWWLRVSCILEDNSSETPLP